MKKKKKDLRGCARPYPHGLNARSDFANFVALVQYTEDQVLLDALHRVVNILYVIFKGDVEPDRSHEAHTALRELFLLAKEYDPHFPTTLEIENLSRPRPGFPSSYPLRQLHQYRSFAGLIDNILEHLVQQGLSSKTARKARSRKTSASVHHSLS